MLHALYHMQAVLAEGLVLGGVEGASAALLFPLFRRLDVVGHGLWVSEDEVAADWRRPSLPARPAACCDAGGSKPGLCGLPGHAGATN